MNTTLNGSLDWPADVDAVVIAPVFELKNLAAKLGLRTKGQLVAEVHSVQSDEHVSHQLDLVLPSRKLRRRLLTATHGREDLYPVEIDAKCFVPMEEPDPDWHFPVAATYPEFQNLLKDVLNSDDVRSAIHSLKAQADLVD
jgi:hypothetical protein